MSLARQDAQRRFPGATIDATTERTLAQIDHQIEIMFDGMVAQIYMYGKEIVTDPGSPERFMGSPNDVARLFLARGLTSSDGTVIPYDDKNPAIRNAQAQLADEVRVIFYPLMLSPNAVTSHFENQKTTILRFLRENTEPFPEGKFFSELIAEKYRENILPLSPMEVYGKPAPDYLAVMHRHAFDQLHKVLAPFFEAFASVLPEPDQRTTRTQPTATKPSIPPRSEP